LVAIIALALSQKISAVAANIPQGEWIIVVGGVSMRQWEHYKAQPHDHWWANFVHAARIRTEQLRAQLDPSPPITWLVYKPSAAEAMVRGDKIALIRKRQTLEDLIRDEVDPIW
jgi:hypothetical protein